MTVSQSSAQDAQAARLLALGLARTVVNSFCLGNRVESLAARRLTALGDVTSHPRWDEHFGKGAWAEQILTMAPPPIA